MTDTPHLGLPLIEAAQAQKHVTHNEAIHLIDALVQMAVKDRDLTAPPGSPVEGDRYLPASGATGAWASWDLNIALFTDGDWTKIVPKKGFLLFVEDEGVLLVWNGAAWVDPAASGGYLSVVGETNIASAATCNIGGSATTKVQITGTTTITSFGTVANQLRLVRFAQALTLTYNASTLILPGAANITTAAGDNCIVTSDASGNWRVRSYVRASGFPILPALPSSTTDNALPRHDGAAGNLQTSGVTVDDNNTMTVPGGVRSYLITLADDTATSITLPTISAILAVVSNASGVPFPRHLVFAHVNTTAVIESLGSGAGATSVDLSTGVKSGTTGTDGHFTISPHTDNKVYFENRRGGSITFAVLVITT